MIRQHQPNLTVVRPPTDRPTGVADLLVVGPDPEYRHELASQLVGEGYRVVAEAGFGIDAATHAYELRPPVAIIHFVEPLARAVETVESMRRVRPEMAIIAVSPIGDGPTVRRGMRAGLADYVIEPLQDGMLTRAIRGVIDRSGDPADPDAPPEVPLGGLVVVYGAKGGIGKSTIATNIAAMLASESTERVSLVDLDYYFGDVATMLNLKPEQHFQTLIQTLQDPGRTPAPIEEYLSRHYSGLWCLAATGEPSTWANPRPETISRVLRQMRRTFDLTVVDAPATMNENVLEALMQATLLLLVTSTDLASVKDAAYLLALARQWPDYEDRVKVVLNHPSDRDALALREIEDYLGTGVFADLPFDRAVRYSTQLGEPVALAAPSSKLGRALQKLAMHVAGMPQPRARRRLRLFRRSA